MSATKEQRIIETRVAAKVMLHAAAVSSANEPMVVKRRLRTPWNNNAHKFVVLDRLPIRWNWTKFEYILS